MKLVGGLLHRLPARQVLLLAWLTVVLAYVAALAALAGDNTVMSISVIFNFDTLRPWFIYHGVVHDAPWALGNWRLANSTFALDMLMSWLLFGLGTVAGTASRAQLVFGMYAVPLAWTCVSALGWIMVCRQAWGPAPSRTAAVLLAHALPFAFFTAGQEYFFTMWFYRVHHVSTWALVPWLWWLWLLALTAPKDRRLGALLTASAALFLVAFSDMTIAAWFTAPALVALPLAAMLNMRRSMGTRMLARRGLAALVRYGTPLVIVTVLARLAANPILFFTPILDLSFATMARSLAHMSGYLGFALENAAITLVCWAALVGCAMLWPLAGLRRLVRGKRFMPASSREIRTGRTAVALLLPASIIVPVLASVVTGLSEPRYAIGKLTIEFRHLLPTIWLPLFVGWALVPWR